MERQLKERLIGAVVLIAAAVVLVPEIFSGSSSHVDAIDVPSSATSADASDSSATSGQLKTYHIQLQDHGDATPVPPEAEASSASPTSADTASIASNTSDPNPASLAANSSASSAAVSSTPAAKPSKPEAAAKTSEPKPAPATEPIKKPAGGKGWVVQIGSFGTDAKAKQIVGSLKAKDYPAFSGPVAVKGKTLYRVRVGPLEERAAADTLLKQLKGAYPEASVVPQAR